MSLSWMSLASGESRLLGEEPLASALALLPLLAPDERVVVRVLVADLREGFLSFLFNAFYKSRKSRAAELYVYGL